MKNGLLVIDNAQSSEGEETYINLGRENVEFRKLCGAFRGSIDKLHDFTILHREAERKSAFKRQVLKYNVIVRRGEIV